MLTLATPNHHWNYFLAIENDLEDISRYIEFSNSNLKAYLIQLAHILLSASFEVDVTMKQLCQLIESNQSLTTINDYRRVIKNRLPSFIDEEIRIDRFGLSYKPWDNWHGEENPNWWRSNNNVKHHRNSHFADANLKNAINAVGALLVTVVYYYKFAFSNESDNELSFKSTTRQLQPEASFMRMNPDYYYKYVIAE